MHTSVILAIDAGTTGNRVLAIDTTGTVAAKSYYEFPQIYPRPGWVEHDPEEIWKTTRRALRDVVDEVGADSIAAIGITNQRETTVIWDRETGRPVHNAIVWQCRRTEALCRELKPKERMIQQTTGLFVDPYFSATKIRWILDHVEGAHESALQGRLAFGTIDTWLLYKLTGGKVHATEPSNASRTMLYNIRAQCFDRELMSLFDIPASLLPEVKDSDALFGVTDPKIFGREIPIHGILGDQQASLFAHCGWKEGVVKNTYGTGLFVMTDTRDNVLMSDSLITTVAWKENGRPSYALEGSIFMGGAMLQWLRDNFGIISTAAESEMLATSITDNEGVYFVPALQGLGAPHWRADTRGIITGLTRRAGKAALVRAALEAMAYQTRDVVEEMQKLLPFRLEVLSVDGGACVNNFLMQFQADMLGIRVERPVHIETTALGAAGISGIAAGFWTKQEFRAAIGAIERTFTPAMDRAAAQSYYDGWKRALKLCLG